MTLKSITLHRPAIDNLEQFHDAGADLIVGDQAKHGMIDAARARELVSGHGAVGHHEAAKQKPAPKTKRPAKARAAKVPTPTPIVIADTPAPVADTSSADD